MAITTVDQLLDALGNSSQQLITNRASISSQIAGGFSSLWRSIGTPAQGAIPTTAAVLDNNTTGAFKFNNPSGGAKSYIGRMFKVCSVAGTDVQYHDRLSHMGGLSGTVTTAQTVNVNVSGSVTNINERRGAADYSDVQWWLEWYTATGVTAVTATVTYTNATGASGRTTTVSIPVSTGASRMLPIIGNAGEYIQSIQLVQLSATTGTAGNFGVTATKILTTISCGLANAGTVADWAYLGMPSVADSACVSMIVLAGSTTTGTVIGSAKLIQG